MYKKQQYKIMNYSLNKINSLVLFFFASISLLISGKLINNSFSFESLLIETLLVLCGIFLIYNFINFEKTTCFSSKIKHFLSYKTQLIFCLLLIILIPLAYIKLSNFSFFIFAFSAFLGVIYSFPIQLKNKVLKLKDVFFLKNLLIGIAWGALVLVGAGSLENNLAIYISIFASIQVFIGSVIRDLRDVECDTNNNTRTFPVVFGVKNTLIILNLTNLSSILIYLFSDYNPKLLVFFSIIIFWRLITLLNLKGNIDSVFWGQTANLFTCCLFLIISLMQFYGNI